MNELFSSVIIVIENSCRKSLSVSLTVWYVLASVLIQYFDIFQSTHILLLLGGEYLRYFMFNKPRGCISACSDPRHKTVLDYFPECEREGLFHVGRLDKDTEGFLIITDDGELCRLVAEPQFSTSKTYRFYAKGEVNEQKLEALRCGVRISARDEALTQPAEVKLLGSCTMREISHLLDDDDARLRHTRKGDVQLAHIEITITEGRKHQVKKMARAVGMYVVYLERIDISGIHLDSSLSRGEYRELTETEVRLLKNVN